MLSTDAWKLIFEKEKRRVLYAVCCWGWSYDWVMKAQRGITVQGAAMMRFLLIMDSIPEWREEEVMLFLDAENLDDAMNMLLNGHFINCAVRDGTKCKACEFGEVFYKEAGGREYFDTMLDASKHILSKISSRRGK